jgi:hypothetical protein
MIATPAGTLIGNVSPYVPVLTKILAGPYTLLHAYLIVFHGVEIVVPYVSISNPVGAT